MFTPMDIKHRSAPSIGQIKIENFYGCNLTDDPSNVKPSFSPACPNMIRTQTGKVGKRPGYHTVRSYGNVIIWGVHFLYGTTTKKLVHAGSKLYLDGAVPTELYSGMAEAVSISHQMNGHLIIQDGTTVIYYNGTTATTLVSNGYIPTYIIARTPSGGGTLLEGRNLIQPKVIVRFAGVAATVAYQLPDVSIDAAEVTIQTLNSGGTFDTLVETTDFTVNRTTGVVTFSVAPGESPVVGEDNVYITYAKTITGYADKINKTNMSILYGMNGARDRLFVAGSSANIDYFSELNDPTYFSEYNYCTMGDDGSDIMGYAIVGEKLATIKDEAENDTNILLRTGALIDGEVAFNLDGAYQGAGALSRRAICNLANEPLFLTTNKTINALTPSDVLGERYSQQRSYYINGAMENEQNAYLSSSFAFVWNQFAFFAIGSKLYVLDGTQSFYEKNVPYSNRQFAGFVWDNIYATVLYEEGGKLCFGDASGDLKVFYDGSERSHYSDDASTAITSYWDTYMDTGAIFAYKKTYSYVAARLGAFPATGVKISAKIDGVWVLLKDYEDDALYLDFGDMTFEEFALSTDTTPRTIGQKINEKNLDKIQFRFENSVLNQNFELYEAYMEFIQSGKYRK